MRIRISDPRLAPDLAEFLRQRVDVAVSEAGEDELEVSLIGSYASDSMRPELDLRIRAWEAARGGAAAELLD